METNRGVFGAGIAAVVAASINLGCTTAGQRADPAPSPSTNAVRTTVAIPTTTLGDLTESNGLAASIRQFREDEAVDVIQVELVRELAPDSAPTDLITVASVRLDWPGFSAVPPTERDVQLAPGQRVDIPTPLGAVVCRGETTPQFSLGRVEVSLPEDDGHVRSVQAPLLADAQAALDNVWTKGCVRQRLLEQVGLEWSPWERSDPNAAPTATGELVVTRRDTPEPISITGVDGSVLLFVSPTVPLGERPATMRPDEPTLTVPVRATGSGRCDGHALGDSKKTYEFQVLVVVGSDDPVGVNVSVPLAERPVLTRVITDTCGDNHPR